MVYFGDENLPLYTTAYLPLAQNDDTIVFYQNNDVDCAKEYGAEQP